MPGASAGLILLEVDVIRGPLKATQELVKRLPGDDVLAFFGWSPAEAVLAVSDRAHDLAGQAALAVLAESAREVRFEPGKVPGAVRELAELLRQRSVAAGQEIMITGGPSFVFPDELPYEPAAILPVIVSDPAGVYRAAQLDRPAGWSPQEWPELVSGRLGSWAMAISGSSPVSICHTPAANEQAAEAGTWTREDFRGLSLAPATARAWHARERQFRKVLFYSLAGPNPASAAVARKLRLDPLGWLWTIRR